VECVNEMFEKKVLIGTPIYNKKNYALKTQLRHVGNINYPNFDQVFFDNTKSDKYYYQLKEKGLKVVRVPRGKNSRDALANSMNLMFAYALEHGYDYCLILENDLYPDPEIINRLLSHNKRVVGSYYLLGLDEDEKNYQEALRLARTGLLSKQGYEELIKGLRIKVPCIFLVEKKESGMKGTRNVTRKEGLAFFNTGLRRVHGVGLGATLVDKSIMLRTSFYYDNRFESKHPDVYFFADLEDAGIPVFLDTSILVEHDPSNWGNVKDR